jgi:poly-gamma-glutamate synthase PgsB/CapB
MVSDKMMENFSYIEHKENVALALKVCTMLGADIGMALKSMQDALPDPGALRKYILELNGKHVHFVNAMAANDPDSTYMIWKSIKCSEASPYVLVNCRSDRIDRSFQMAKLIKDRLKAEGYFLTGQATDVLMRELVKSIPKGMIVNLGNQEPVAVVKKISGKIPDKSMIFAIGNTVGYGEILMHEFLLRKIDAIG